MITTPSGCQPSVGVAVIYSLIITVFFVGSLYAFVPPRIRQLDRNNASQIRWRTLATSTVCLGAWILYPLMLCNKDNPALIMMGAITFKSLLDTLHVTFMVLLHTASIYLGPIVQEVLEVYDAMRMAESYGVTDLIQTLGSVFSVKNGWGLGDTEQGRWMRLRNYVIAPLTEEILFRGCIVSAMASTGISLSLVSLISPTFFGLAHVHHAFRSWQQGVPLARIFMLTMFQFIYTSLFGIYTSYVYLQTKSLLSVTASHAFCNYMGLPDLAFTCRTSNLYCHRHLLWFAHTGGIFLYAVGFYSLL